VLLEQRAEALLFLVRQRAAEGVGAYDGGGEKQQRRERAEGEKKGVQGYLLGGRISARERTPRPLFSESFQ
jgi:hypothetical protein